MSAGKQEHGATPRPPSRALVSLLAVTAGVIVANLYYCQPILGTIGTEFHAPERAVSLLVTATQLGYAASLLLMVPLGDMVERRRLIILTALASALVLVGVGFAPSLGYMVVGSFVLGAASVTPQLVVPYAAGLVGLEGRGRLVGAVMSGLLVGILLSRVLSGLLAAVAGWRAVYWVSAGLVLALCARLKCCLPPQAPERRSHRHYGQLLFSLWEVARTEPALRRHSIVGACGFAAFSVFWTTLAFHLASLPGHYGSSVAGLFGLFGAAGAIAAPVAGRLADRHHPQVVNGAALGLVAVSFVLMGVAGASLSALALGVVAMDAGLQGSHISNQTRIFALSAALRNRVNSVFMVSCFIGATLGSVLGSWAWARGGWTWVCCCGALLAAAGQVPLWLPTRAASRSERAAAGVQAKPTSG